MQSVFGLNGLSSVGTSIILFVVLFAQFHGTGMGYEIAFGITSEKMEWSRGPYQYGGFPDLKAF